MTNAENSINIEKIMEEIRAQAKAQSNYTPGAEFGPRISAGQKLHFVMVRAGREIKGTFSKFAGKFTRLFVSMYLFFKNQLKNGKNTILDTAAKTNELSGFVHGDIESRLAALEAENEALRAELNAIKKQN